MVSRSVTVELTLFNMYDRSSNSCLVLGIPGMPEFRVTQKKVGYRINFA